MNPQLQLMLQQAIQAFQGGNFDSADLILKRVLQVDSKNLPALHVLGLIRVSQSNYKEAADYLARAVRIHPNDASLQYNLAKALSDSGNDKDASTHYKKSVTLAPNNPEAWLCYGKSASNLGRYEDALVCYSKALILKPDYAEAALNKGATFKELKRYEEAIVLAEQALVINPNLAEAWLNKGVALKELNRYDDALAHYDKALNLKSDYHEAWNNKGRALYELKRYSEVIDHYDKALSFMPDYHEAWNNKGIALYELKRYDEAIAHYDRALSLKPDYHEAWNNKGRALYELKRYSEVIDHYDKALSFMPDYHEGWNNKGISLYELKRYDEAIAHYDRALSLKPDYHEAWINKGVILHELKRYDEAIAHYDRALNLKPDYAEAWSNKGVTLHELKRYGEAIAHYDRALNLNPDYVEAWSNKGSALNELKRYDEAITHYDRALNLNPDYAEAWSNKGITLNELKRYDEAITHYDRALSLKPDIDWIYGDLLHAKMKICSWSGLAESLENISKKVMKAEKVANPFQMLALNDDAQVHKKSTEIYAQAKYPSRPILDLNPKAAQRERIRIAYFSPDFRNHPVSLLTSELFEIHDRRRFEVFAFSLKKAFIDDEINLRLRKGFDRFIDVDEMSDREIAQLARELEIDIAIDLAGPTQYSRTGIFSYRAAPIQVNWLGYPGTIGADFIDYIVADKILIQVPDQQFYTEKIVYLPNTYMVDDSKRVASSRVFTREECGLPQNAFVFCCFNNDYKFNPQVLDCWSRILSAVKASVLWISENNSCFRENIKNEFEKRGIDPTRIIFAERVELTADHLARYALADLFLDTHPYNAHTTAVDSLKAGTPVLTLKGQSFSSRVAASLLNAAGIPELITVTQEEYEALAILLALNPQKLSDIKLKLSKNRFSEPLFDTPLFAKNLEAAYIEMHRKYQAGKEPDHIEVF